MNIIYGLLIALLSLAGCTQEITRIDPNQNQLGFSVKNNTKKPLYATCFSYIKKDNALRWRWHKSPVYLISGSETARIEIGQVKDRVDRTECYGYLSLFRTQQEAEDAIYELVDDKHKVDLDLLHKINNKTIEVGVEKYGITGEIFDYDFIPDEVEFDPAPELDFTVENKTDHPVYATAFIYQKKEDMPVWRYDKSPVIRIEAGSTGLIDVDTISDPNDRKYMRGYLAVFDEDEKEDADNVTYELLTPQHKIKLGLLAALRDKNVILHNEQYGVMGNLLDFSINSK